ncbi:hypothetical protein LEN26_007661 [Aphanomyces euteiches]|nr:hypothetical protein AeMF1_005725 [Aphanomyces euteiches]KAH9131555.1 hypothetical protein LEN26_007661 [Aphanomyces euteiches]KAH9183817.1 hypothetical protein AeNC1_014206 [Aphanomyces euteiches]
MADYNAIVIGSTGAVGRELVKLLAASSRCKKVVAFSRRAIEPPSYPSVFPGLSQEFSEKVAVHTVDFDNLQLQDFAAHNADACFCTLGTTRADAGSAEAFIKVDLHYVTKAAELSKEASIPYFGLLTAANTAKNSWFLYPRTKGLAEEAIKNTAFIRTGIFRPGLIRRGDLARGVERIGSFVMPTVSAAAVARAMISNYESSPSTGLTTVNMSEIQAFDKVAAP